MTKRADKYEDGVQTARNVGVCSECGAKLTLALAEVLAARERVRVRCRQCEREHEVQEAARMSARLVFAAWLQGDMAAPQGEDDGDQVTEAGFLLLVLAFARLAFAHVVEGVRAHGGTSIIKSGLLQAQTALTTAVASIDESDCRRTLQLLGDASDQEVLAHYTRVTLAFPACQRYTQGLVERVLVTAGAVEGSKASLPLADPELAQAYDEVCTQTYVELRDAVWTLCQAFLPFPPPSFPHNTG